jgi:hypothetical protein
MLHSAPITWINPPSYSSPGTPDATWATTGQKGIFVDKAGNVSAVASFTGTVNYSYPANAVSPFQDSILSEAPTAGEVHGTSGIQAIGSDVFLYQNPQHAWTKVNLLGVSLQITLTDGQKIPIATASDLNTKVAAVLLF